MLRVSEVWKNELYSSFHEYYAPVLELSLSTSDVPLLHRSLRTDDGYGPGRRGRMSPPQKRTSIRLFTVVEMSEISVVGPLLFGQKSNFFSLRTGQNPLSVEGPPLRPDGYR